MYDTCKLHEARHFCFGTTSIQGSANHVVETWQVMYKNGQCFAKKKECMNQQELELLWLFHNYLSEMISTRLSDLVEEFINYQMLHKTLTPLNSKLYLCSA